MSAKLQFKPIGMVEASDEQIEAFAARKGMPTLVRAQAEQASQAQQLNPNTIRRVALNLPDYITSQLQTRALQQRCTTRHIIMMALRKDGIEINDTDMVTDGRRVR